MSATITAPSTELKGEELSKLDQLSINTIRTLAMDAVQKANSGHPGTPMALAPVAYVLWERYLRHNPRNPQWANRDRLVLSAGHASMLLYSMLHRPGVQRRRGGALHGLPLECAACGRCQRSHAAR